MPPPKASGMGRKRIKPAIRAGTPTNVLLPLIRVFPMTRAMMLMTSMTISTISPHMDDLGSETGNRVVGAAVRNVLEDSSVKRARRQEKSNGSFSGRERRDEVRCGAG
jgi:hypothetical protein